MTDQPQQTVIIPSRPMRATSIKGLIPALPERGKVKIGIRGKTRTSKDGNEFQPPIKLDHFVITTLERGSDNNLVRDDAMHEMLGEEKPTALPIRLLYDDPELNFISRYAAYKGRTLWCSGDGERATRLGPNNQFQEISCPCFLSDPAYAPKSRSDLPRCKMNGALSVIIDGASGLGGVWKFRTTSYNSINGILSSMMFLRRLTGGILANIPLKLKIQPKQAVAPTDGSPVQIYFVTLEYDGDMQSLQQTAHQIALDRATTRVSIAEIETEARRVLALAAPANAPLPGDDAEEVVAEWYPEQYDEEDEGRPTRQQFRQAAANGSGIETEVEVGNEAQGDGESETSETDAGGGDYCISIIDGRDSYAPTAELATQVLMDDMKLRADQHELLGLSAAWQDNEPFILALADEGHVELVQRLQEQYRRLEKQISNKLTKVRTQPVPTEAQKQPLRPAQMNATSGPPPIPAEVQQEKARAPFIPLEGTLASDSSGTTAPAIAGGAERGTLATASSGVNGPSAPANSVATTSGGNIKCEEVRYGPGRGINWRATLEKMQEQISGLSAEELMSFRQVNERLLMQMKLSWKDGLTTIEKAIVARNDELK